MSSIISVYNLQFKYQTSHSGSSAKLILNIPSLDFKSGESVFIFGSSGSGKTTFLEILSGVLDSSAGEVLILGQKFHELTRTQKDQFRSQNIGYIFQQFNLIPYLTVKDNILLPFVFNHKKVNLDLYQKLLSDLGLVQYEHHFANQLSVGQQQIVAAARALVIEPKIILADEPTSALDYDHRESFLKIIFQLVQDQKSTLLFVSHDRSIMHMFDRQLNLLDINQVGVK